MKKLNLITLLLGAALFLGLGVTTASAEMKCGAGKCGSAMTQKVTLACGNENCACGENCQCGDVCKCGEKTAPVNKKSCNSCDDKAPVKAMKCGAGKCGSK